MDAVDIYITDYPDTEIQVLMHEVHQLLLQTVPQIQPCIKWKLPFYMYCKRNFAYINVHKKRLYLALYYGHLLSDTHSILVAEGRKQIKVVYFDTIEDIHQTEVFEIIQEAMLVNEQI